MADDTTSPDATSPPATSPDPASSTAASPGGTALPPLPPGYVWARPVPPPEPPTVWKAPRWLKVTAVAWVVVLIAAAVVYQFKGGSTVREQTTVAAARPVVDAAIRDVVAAAGPDPVIAVSGFVSTGACDVTPVRSGARYQRQLDLYTAPGTESALLHTIADGLPERYHAEPGEGAQLTLAADAGDFVAVVGAAPAPGHLVIRALTGCRPVGDLDAATASPAAPGPAASEVADALSALEQPPAPATVVVACGVAGAQTVSAARPATGPVTLSALSAAPVYGSATTIAYRDNGVDVVVRHTSEDLTITATTRC